ncbi:MAG: hypothetical protein ACOWWH_11300 [Eubacteriaceae bacterium]
MTGRTKNNDGYTLIEAVIVIAFIVVVLTVLFNVFFISRNIFVTGVDKASLQHDARIVSDAIIDELKSAKEVSAVVLTGNYYSLSLESGNVVIKYNGTTHEILGQYINNITFKNNSDSNIVNIVIDASNGGETYSIDTSVMLNNTTVDLTSNPSVIYYSLYD